MDVLLNGRFVPYEEATIGLEDRAVQFAESVYEVIRGYNGRAFEMERHMRRMQESAEAIGLNLGPRLAELGSQSLELLKRNGLQDALIYLQASFGAAPRVHLRPTELAPTLLAIVRPVPELPERLRAQGVSTITVPDDRWARCYVKTTMLLPNTAAKRRAVDAGCDDAIFVRDGFLTEATAANVFAVFDGVVWTPPKSNYILHGVTRDVVLEVAASIGVPCVEGPIPATRLSRAEEIFMTGTASELLAVTSLDGITIGSGIPGPMVARLHGAFRRRVAVATL